MPAATALAREHHGKTARRVERLLGMTEWAQVADELWARGWERDGERFLSPRCGFAVSERIAHDADQKCAKQLDALRKIETILRMADSGLASSLGVDAIPELRTVVAVLEALSPAAPATFVGSLRSPMLVQVVTCSERDVGRVVEELVERAELAPDHVQRSEDDLEHIGPTSSWREHVRGLTSGTWLGRGRFPSFRLRIGARGAHDTTVEITMCVDEVARSVVDPVVDAVRSLARDPSIHFACAHVRTAADLMLAPIDGRALRIARGDQTALAGGRTIRFPWLAVLGPDWASAPGLERLPARRIGAARVVQLTDDVADARRRPGRVVAAQDDVLATIRGEERDRRAVPRWLIADEAPVPALSAEGTRVIAELQRIGLDVPAETSFGVSATRPFDVLCALAMSGAVPWRAFVDDRVRDAEDARQLARTLTSLLGRRVELAVADGDVRATIEPIGGAPEVLGRVGSIGGDAMIAWAARVARRAGVVRLWTMPVGRDLRVAIASDEEQARRVGALIGRPLREGAP